MTSIQAALKLLSAIKPTKEEICKVKILLAAHGEWVTSKQIREKANLNDWKNLGLTELCRQGLIKEMRLLHIVKCGKKCRRRHYKTIEKGEKYIIELMK